MIVKASGRSALILAAGLFVCFAGPSRAAAGAGDATPGSKSDTAGAPIALSKYARHGAHHWKKIAHRKSGKVASKPSTDKSADTTDAAADDGANSSGMHPSQIPPTVANANAQLTAADAPTDAAKALAARASSIVQGTPDGSAATQPLADATPDSTQVVAADQLNDVDRSLHENSAPAPTLVLASADTSAPAVAVAASNESESSAWDQTSLIGKIFIGFGALLTMASAARMFMA